MALSGWYPDPGGSPGEFRYWDGQAWSSTTTTNPADPAPGAPGPSSSAGSAASRPPKRRSRRGALLAVLVAVLVLVVVSALVLGNRSTTPAADPLPSSSVSGGNDSSPTATPLPESPSAIAPTEAPSAPQPTRSLRTDSCPQGDPYARQEHPADGRVHGGGLNIPAQPGWATPGPQLSVFSWAYDVGETDLRVQPHWYSGFAVGAVSVADGFDDPRTGAELAMECTASSLAYRNVTSRTDLVDAATTVGGHPAWTIRSEIRADDDRTTFEGDVVEVTFVDLDSPEALGFFWGCAPIGQIDYIDRLDRTAAGLAVG